MQPGNSCNQYPITIFYRIFVCVYTLIVISSAFLNMHRGKMKMKGKFQIYESMFTKLNSG